MPAHVPDRIFISYRRHDTGYAADRLHGRLASRFSEVFLDIDAIALGERYAEVLTEKVRSCDVLLALIGPQWLSALNQGRRTPDSFKDWVRFEIEVALAGDVRVIPVLIDLERPPAPEELPAGLQELAGRQAEILRRPSFDSDADRLIEKIRQLLHPPPKQPPGGPAPDPTPVHVLQHPRRVEDLAFSPDGKLLATAGSDRTARIWEIATGQQHSTPFVHDDMVFGVAFSRDGRRLATASRDNTARIWEIATGQEQEHSRITHYEPVTSVAFNRAGRLLATASADGTAQISDALTGRQRVLVTHDMPEHSFPLQSNAVDCVAFSPDGTLLATASWDGTARIWEAVSGKELARFTHQGWVSSVAFSPDGNLLATASNDKTARIYGVDSGQEPRTFSHDESVVGVAFSPDGQLLATASDDHTGWIWDVTVAEHERSRVVHDGKVSGVAFSPDGRLLATASEDQTARIWTLVG